MKYSKSIIALSLTTLLAACGGSDDDKSDVGKLSLGVSDNPANAESVTIAFKQVVLKPANGSDPLSFDVSEDGELKQVDLLTVQGQEIEPLITGVEVPLGEYQMCIYMQTDEVPNADGSYVGLTGDITEGLTTNSNGSCGGVHADEAGTGRLFFNKAFTIAAGDNDFVAEFDLNKGLQAPHGNKAYWTLKPTSVQLVNNAEVGAIQGSVDTTVMTDCETDFAGSTFSHAVYLYPADTTLANMVDFRLDADILAPQVAPVAAARVNEILDDANNVTGYEYEFGFVAAGNYQLGYTCSAQNDDPEVSNPADDLNAPVKIFAAYSDTNITVTEGETAEANF
ncbi:DUF4382 domain-containing protein [Shewanella sp. Isolate11]|uniref:DUF4382 domain-containing protein n=1 Tax=Shewanella sp. Isolate11 TaxID=2908530 RepID=UPI001EFDB377|nr:DUF4382 domain-containing protein [Shewanella sp. Isolate11]MCG9698249.1 DUF4382 domain-containing protein [Shewanella sp. Isolate11]